MEVFQTAGYVRLQSLVHGMYVHAAEDGCSVRLDARYASHNAVWAVERHHSAGTDYILLRGVYGRYLGAPDTLSKLFPCPRVAAAQRDFDEPEMKTIMWQVITTSGGAVARSGGAVARSGRAVQLKSAFGRFLRTGASLSRCLGLSTGREWTVHAVPQTVVRPPLVSDNVPLSRLCLRRRSLEREIRWALADRSGAINEKAWAKFLFIGRDKSALEEQLNDEVNNFPISMFVRAGRHGQPTPLLVNLPHSREPLRIVAFWDTAANDLLVFPDANAPMGDVEMGEFRRIRPAAGGQDTTEMNRPGPAKLWRR